MYKLLFGAAFLAIATGRVVTADDQADARAIVDEAIKASGGEAALGKFVAAYFKVKGTGFDADQKIPVSFEWFMQGKDKLRTLLYDDQNKLTEIEVVNGKEGWVKDDNQTTERLSDEQVAARQELVYVTWATTFVPLKDQEFRLSLLEDTSVAGRKAVGILVTHDKHAPLKVYFDAETHLMVKYQHKIKNAEVGKEFDEECVYSDYRPVQEMKQPFRVVTFWDGVKMTDLTVAEQKYYEKPLDEKLFVKP